jgi:hypothetical protein
MRPFAIGMAGVLIGCGGGEVEIRGDLEEGAAATHAWVVGGGIRTPVEEGAFALRAPRGEVVDLRLGTDDGELGRMELRELPGRGSLRLRRVWVDRGGGLAFPAEIGLDRGRFVEVNGIRMGDPRRLPARIDLDAEVLAVSGDAEALLVRPLEQRVPDLPVVVTPATEVSSPDGDPLTLRPVEAGDTLRIRAERTGGFLVALRIRVPRRTAVRDEVTGGSVEAGAAAAPERTAGTPLPTASPNREASGASSSAPRGRPPPSSGERRAVGNRPGAEPPGQARRREDARDPPRGRGRGRGSGRGGE